MEEAVLAQEAQLVLCDDIDGSDGGGKVKEGSSRWREYMYIYS